MDINVLVGQNLRKARLAAGLTQEELAHQSGMTSVYISQIENGHANPTLAILGDLASALGLRVTDLIEQRDV